jgi:hypothetical protein
VFCHSWQLLFDLAISGKYLISVVLLSKNIIKILGGHNAKL